MYLNSMYVTLFIIASIIGQLLLTVSFAKEALTTKEGTYCRVKCSVAATAYLFFAILMSWLLFINPITL